MNRLNKKRARNWLSKIFRPLVEKALPRVKVTRLTRERTTAAAQQKQRYNDWHGYLGVFKPKWPK